MEERLLIDEVSLQNELRPYEEKPYEALFEYIWNSFDAHAKNVTISYTVPDMGYIEELVIEDDGDGWDFEAKNTKYFLSSLKSQVKVKGKTLPHGSWGRGRYVFIWFADLLIAESGGRKLELTSNANLKGVSKGEYVKKGTRVSLRGIHEKMNNSLILEESFRQALVREYCWFLKENPNMHLRLNGKEIDPSVNVKQQAILTKADFSEELQSHLRDDTRIEMVLWEEKPREFAKYYFINPDTNEEELIQSTSLNKKRDNFWHSVYVKSDLFKSDDVDAANDGDQLDILSTRSVSKIKKQFIHEIRQKLLSIRKPLLVEKSQEIIDEILEAPNLPSLESFGIYDKESFEDLLKQAFVIAPSLFTGKSIEERSFIYATFAGLLSSSDTSLIQLIISQLQELTPEEQNDLQHILKRTTLSNVVRTMKEIDARLDIIDDLNRLLFELEPYTKEVVHLQQVLNLNTWVFGEEYRLFADTEGAIRKTLLRYANEILELQEATIDTASRKELDLLLVKQIPESSVSMRNLVVEIKRPNIRLGKKELDQIKEYARTIMGESVCNGDNMRWDFYLVGNDYDSYIQDEMESLGQEEKGLVFQPRKPHYRVFVRKWSDIIHVELGHKMKYLKDSLERKANESDFRSSDEIVDDIVNSRVLASKDKNS